MKGKAGRPNQGKTETIKERSVYVYLPTVKSVKEWKAAAQNSGLPLSGYIFECVERIRNKGSVSATPRLTLEMELKDCKIKLGELEKNTKILDAAYRQRDSEVKKLSEELAKKQEKNVPELDMAKNLVRRFKDYPEYPIDITEVMESMGIKPNEPKKLAVARNALSMLEYMGIIRRDPGGSIVEYEWLGDRSNPPKRIRLKED